GGVGGGARGGGAGREAGARGALEVPSDSGTAVWPRSPCPTGSTRASSTSIGTGADPGRVDSPPTSSRSAPCSTSRRPWATAASADACRPPSEKLSGVTLTMPMTSGRTPMVRTPSGRCHSCMVVRGALPADFCNEQQSTYHQLPRLFHHVHDLDGEAVDVLLAGGGHRLAQLGDETGDRRHQHRRRRRRVRDVAQRRLHRVEPVLRLR